MTPGTDDWNAMMAIIDDYEEYYLDRIQDLEALRIQLSEQALNKIAVNTIKLNMYTIASEMDTRFINDVYACAQFIPQSAWDNYQDYLDGLGGGTP